MSKDELKKIKEGLDLIIGDRIKKVEEKVDEVSDKKIDEAIDKLTKFFADERKTLNEVLTSKYLSEITKTNSIDELCKKIYGLIKKEGETKEVIVKNQKEFPKIEIPKFPKEIKVSNLSKSDSPIIVEAIKDLVLRFKSAITAFISNKETTEAIPVRLVDKDGRTFYNAQFYANVGGGGVDLTKTENRLEEIEDNTEPALTPIIYNISMTNANQEYSQILPNNTRIIDIKLRALNALLKISFVVGESGTKYITIPFGASFHLEGIKLSGATIYVQSPVASQVLEIICWT